MNALLASPLAAQPAAVLGGVLLALLIMRLGRGEFPVRLFAAALSIGVVTATLVLFVEAPFELRTNPHGFSPFVAAFGFAGFPEEAAKMAGVWFFLRTHWLRRGPRDLVLAAATASLGFALLENMLYIAAAGQHWGQLAMMRASTAVPFHVFLGLIGGFAFARAECEANRIRGALRVAATWIAVSTLHGLYDWPLFLMNARPPYPPLVSFLVERSGLTPISVLYGMSLVALVCISGWTFASLRALDRPPFPGGVGGRAAALASPNRIARFLLARPVGFGLAALLIVPSLIGLGVFSLFSYIADQMVIALLTAFAVACPIAIGLMLIRFPPRPRTGKLSLRWRRSLQLGSTVAAMLAVFSAYRWGEEPMRKAVAAGIELRGVQAAARGDHEAALREFDRALAISPTFVDALVKRSVSDYALERYDRALADLDEAVLLQPRNVDLLVQRAQLHRARHQPLAVIADIDRALDAAPDAPALWAESAKANLEAKNPSKARADIARALELGPHDPRTLTTRAILSASDGDFDGALQSLNEALSTNPSEWTSLFLRGRVWLYKQDARKAAADFERVNAEMTYLYPALWLFIARSRAGDDGAPELSARASRSSNHEWPFPVARRFLGQVSAAEMRAAAVNDDQRCEADFYEAEFLLGRGQPATELMQTAWKECPTDFVEYEGAGAELRRLDSEAATRAAAAASEPPTPKLVLAAAPEDTPSPPAGSPAAVAPTATATAHASITSGVGVFTGNAIWTLVDHGASGSELGADLRMSSAIHERLSLRRSVAAGATSYEIAFAILDGDRTSPPYLTLGASLGSPRIIRARSLSRVPGTSEFRRVDETSYRMTVPSQEIETVLSEIETGAEILIVLNPSSERPARLWLSLNPDTARVARLAAAAWRRSP